MLPGSSHPSKVDCLPSIEDDSGTWALIASLSLEDIDDVQSCRKGKGREDCPPTDEELALQLFAEEAKSLLGVTSDAILARSVDSALRTDKAVQQQFVSEEAAAARDREFALALSQGRQPPASTGARATGSTAVPNVKKSAGEFFGIAFSSDEETRTPGESSNVTLPARASSLSETKISTTRRKNECVICGDSINGPEVVAPCGHFYDTRCLIDLFKATITDESLFPPRCCNKPFLIEDVRGHLGANLAASFEKKALEFQTADRVYCHYPTCSTFLGGATQSAVPIRCPSCLAETCAHCKDAAHPFMSCSSKMDDTVRALAAQEGWKQCPGCRRLVELTHGCYHMTCMCRKQFCYVCTATWKTCTCPQWDENRLIAAAEHRVNRQIENTVAGTARRVDRDRLVAREAERLRTDHNCQHFNWSLRHGGGNCENCGNFLKNYLLRCRGCQMLACVRCQRNRL